MRSSATKPGVDRNSSQKSQRPFDPMQVHPGEVAIGYTNHGRQRASQRGFRQLDVELIRRCGTEIPDPSAEVYQIRSRDVEQEIGELKQLIIRLERLRGSKVVIAENQLVTVYRPSREREKFGLRRAR